ncbi:MAG: OstA-like protein [Sediminibacterium sp.]|jgi:lipopolysaccharide export system protein LptA
MIKRTLIILCSILSYALVIGQTTAVQNNLPAAPTVDSNSKLIEFLSAESYNLKKMDSMDFLILVGHVKIRQGKTLLYGDSIVLNTTKNTLEGFKNIHINDADSVHTYSDYLKYIGNTKKAYLRKKVRLTDGKGVLTTDSLDYDVSVKIGYFKNGGTLIRNKTRLKSVEGYYYGVTRDVIFRRKVEANDPENKIYTDTLEYNTYSQLANFISPTKIISGSRIIRTSNGNYNLGTKKGYMYERSSIDDSTYTFIADDMAINDSLGLGEFRGNVVYKSKDTLGFDLLANNIKTDKKKSALLATELPLLLIKQTKDTLYISADTLYSGKITDLNRPFPKARDSVGKMTDSTLNKYFEAFHHVQIYSDSLQAKCDSLFYSLSDSTIRLISKPIVWANNNQITGDTIFMYVQNKKPEQLNVFNNALAINKIDSTDFYNQIKGTRLNAWFNDGELVKMRCKGNAENIYFAMDNDKNFVGVNHSNAQIIEITFENSEPAKVIFRNQLKGKLTPIQQTIKTDLKLNGFKWLEELRPKSKFDILAPK